MIALRLEIQKVPFADKPVLFNLMQLYLYESSQYDGWDVTEHGYYRYGYIDQYWTEEGRHPFFVRVNGKLAGLALVRTIAGDTTESSYYSMAEFWIMVKYRGKGLGKRAAFMLFDMFQGRWHVGQTPGNKPAQEFWRRVIAEYTGGKYSEELLPDEDFPWLKGPVQKLEASGRTLVYLVRHAESPYTPDELGRPLSEKGKRDANFVAEALEYEDLDMVYSSPYKRAIQTVTPLAEQQGISVVEMPDFRERLLSTETVNFEVGVAQTWADFSLALPGGESNAQAQARGVSALMKVVEENKGKRIAIGTHGTLMGLMLNALDKRYDMAFWRSLDIPDVYLLVFDGQTFLHANRVWRRRG